MFFLIVGVRPRRRPVDPPRARVLHCPPCGTARTFEEHEVRNVLELFFLPLFPVSGARGAWVCERCGLELDVAHSRSPRDSARTQDETPLTTFEPTRIHCVHCGGRLEIEAGGPQSIRCPHCGHRFRVEL
jgi:DNA-directed RNA polymerase subunit RPC12/RpoP